MRKILSIIIVMILLIISVFSGCTDSYTQTTTETITTTTTTQPVTQNTEVDRESLLEGNPTGYATMNSVGGINVNIKEKYIGSKTIKYYTTTISFYNSVGDLVADDISGKTEMKQKVSGPVEPNGNIYIYGDPLFYAQACTEVHIEEIEFEYMDGTKEQTWYGKSWRVQYDF